MQFTRFLACAALCATTLSAWAQDAAQPLNLTLPESVIGSAPEPSNASAVKARKQRCVALRKQRNQLEKDPIDPATGMMSSSRGDQIKSLNAEMQRIGCWKRINPQ